jgi:hypothetical protein
MFVIQRGKVKSDRVPEEIFKLESSDKNHKITAGSRFVVT